MFKRELYASLLTWKNRANRKPLILRGARQVGKTTLVSEFGKSEYSRFINLNLEIKEYHTFFKGTIQNVM